MHYGLATTVMLVLTNSTIEMPLSRHYWRVGGDGSYYGDGLHTDGINDYYATTGIWAMDLMIEQEVYQSLLE